MYEGGGFFLFFTDLFLSLRPLPSSCQVHCARRVDASRACELVITMLMIIVIVMRMIVQGISSFLTSLVNIFASRVLAMTCDAATLVSGQHQDEAEAAASRCARRFR